MEIWGRATGFLRECPRRECCNVSILGSRDMNPDSLEWVEKPRKRGYQGSNYEIANIRENPSFTILAVCSQDPHAFCYFPEL